MAAMISYSVAVTPMDTSASSITVTRPPAYSAGNLLVMTVSGGGTAGTPVSASTPSGWSALSTSGVNVFIKTASSGEPASYTVTMASACCIAASVAAYPAATIASHSFGSSAAAKASYTASWPSASSSQLVLAAAGAVASLASGTAVRNAGYQNVVFPPGLTPGVPAFGPALPDNVPGVYPCCSGLYEVTGAVAAGLPAPVFTSPQLCTISAGFIVLTLTGSVSTLSVTATVNYPQGTCGVALTVKALSGAASPAAIAAGGAALGWYASGTSQDPQATLRPNASGSYVYGAVAQDYAVTSGSTFTPNTSTTFSQNVADTANTCVYGTFRSAGATSAVAPVTLGGTAPANPYTTLAAAEILAAPGSSLAETGTVTAAGTAPGNFPAASAAQAAVFTSPPAQGSLLVAMVAANSNWSAGNATVTMTDTAGLTWYLLAEQQYPSYSGVFIAQIAAVPSYDVLDEAGGYVLDEAGGNVEDESAPGAVPSPFTPPGRASLGRRSAGRGSSAGSPGAPYVYVPVIPSVFYQPGGASPRHPSARRGASRGSAGAPYVYVPVIPAPYYQPGSAVPPHPAARRGAAQGSAGAPYSAVSPYPHYVILDESGSPVNDEGAGLVYDESGPGPLPGTPAWSAARAGLPGDDSAVNWANQVSQFLTSQNVTPVYQGNRIWTPAVSSPSASGSFGWIGQATAAWLSVAAVSQPFTLPPGSATVGRVQLPVQPLGSGADLQVSLCPDNGSGSPNLANVLASAVIPAAHLNAACATGSLATGAGPLQVARGNTCLIGGTGTFPWTQPAVSANGAGSYATPVTSGGFTALIGGYDTVAGAPIPYVATVASLGNTVSGGTVQPPLPQAARYAAAAITADSVVVAGGQGASAVYANVWTASWDAPTGTIGAWSAQQALPQALAYAAAASWGTTVYVIGGSTNATATDAVNTVYYASESSGQVTAWASGPPLPVKLFAPYAAVIGDWLVVTGGMSTAGVTQPATWYSAINSDGSLAGWQQGPALPQPVLSFGPGWNLAVTDSAMVIVSGPENSTGSFSPYTQVLTVSPDGPADAWQVQNWTGSTTGAFQVAAYPAGPPGEWNIVNLHVTTFDLGSLYPVPLLSVPLPASGLTPGATYHVVLRQSGGSAVNAVRAGAVNSGSGSPWLYAPLTGGAWTSVPGEQIAVNVLDQTAGGPVYHLAQDAGAGLASLVWSGAGASLLGLMESTAFPAGSPEAVLPAVTQVTWSGGYPAGLTSLA